MACIECEKRKGQLKGFVIGVRDFFTVQRALMASRDEDAPEALERIRGQVLEQVVDAEAGD